MGKKSQQGALFFQKRPFPKKQTALMPIFCPKNVYSLKNTVLTCNFFFKFVMKNPLLSCPYLVKKTSILTKLYYIMGQKSQQDALFSDFSRKNYYSHVHILSKKPPKKHIVLMSIFCEKNVHSLKNTVLSCHSFQIFHEKPNSVMPIFVKKNVNSVINTLQYGTKSQQDSLFSDFHEKIIALMPIFCQKTSIL